MGNYEKALEYYLILLEMNYKIWGPNNVADYYNYLGRAYYELDKYDSALVYYKKSLILSEKQNVLDKIAQSEYNIGLLYFRKQEFDESLVHHLKSLELRKQVGRNISTYTSLNKIGLLYQKQGNYSEAMNYLTEGLELARELNDGHFMEESYLLLSELFELKNENNNSLKYYKLYKAISDSLFRMERNKELSELQVKFDVQSKEKEIILEKKKEIESTRQRSVIVSIAAGSFVLIVVLIVILFYQRYRARIRRNLLFSEQKALRAQMNPHFIFNSLGSIQNFILKQDADTANDYLTKFSCLIRQVLDNSKHNTITLTQELETLENYLFLEKVRFGKTFDYSVHVAPELNPSMIEIPPMLIQPVLENAILHGLAPANRKGLLKLEIKRTSDTRIAVIIEDNGIGRAKSAEINKTRKAHKSTGLKNVYERIELLNKTERTDFTIQIADKVSIEGEAGGTVVTIEMPFGD